MMAEQQEKCDQKSVKLLLGKVAAACVEEASSADRETSRGEVYHSRRRGHRKLGSDGESETSPDTSLSPVDVDSLEGKMQRILTPL